MKKSILSKAVMFLLVAIFLTQPTLLFASHNHEQSINDMISDPSIWVNEVLAIQEQMLREAEEFHARNSVHESDSITPFNFNLHGSSSFYEPELIHGLRAWEFESLAIEVQEELANLDYLAELIVLFYKSYGFIPDAEEFFASYGSRSSITANDASRIFAELGFLVQSFAVSASAAWIGIRIGLVAAIPVAQVVALVTGVTIISGGLLLAIIGAYANAHAIAHELRTMVGSDAWRTEVAVNNIAQTQAFDRARNSGHTHFIASRTNTPGGGVLIGHQIDVFSATARLTFPEPFVRDVFSVSMEAAGGIARAAVEVLGHGHSWVLHPGHNLVNQPLNRPHFNVFRISPRVEFGHSFY